jgi:hypothetical protein
MSSENPKIVLELPLSPAMCALLDNMATLAKDDEIPHLEGEIEEAEREGNANKAAELRALMGAYDDFWEVVTAKLHPEVLEEAQASINRVVDILRDAKNKGEVSK